MSCCMIRKLTKCGLRYSVLNNCKLKQKIEKKASVQGCFNRFFSSEGSDSQGWDHSEEKNEEKKESKAGKYKSPWKLQKYDLEGEASMKPRDDEVPKQTDILIIGGGVIGSSVAYWIKQQNPKALSITVVERDPVYTRASSMLSCGGIRCQFSVPENVQLSMCTSSFLTNIKQHLSVLHESLPDVQFNHQGYLFLAPPRAAEQLSKNVSMQREQGAQVVLLTKKQLAEKYPWMNLDGIECASLGLEGEGWFDPWSLVRALKQKNMSMATRYVHGELISFDFHSLHSPDDTEPRLDSAMIRTVDGCESETKFSKVINCAGPWAREVAEMAKIGTGQGALALPLPVEPRKRFVYVTHCPDGPSTKCPFVIDPSGVYFRREGLGGHYICGSSPATEAEEPNVDNFDVDYSFYDESVWPIMAKRAPCFNNSKLKSAWAGYYDYNVFDQNLVIGPHPCLKNFIFANGLSGHGLQHSVGIGRAIMELIVYGEYKTINLEKFHFDRFFTKTAIVEEGII